MPLGYTSANPVTITTGENSQEYTTWKPTGNHLQVNADAGTASLTVNFALFGVDGNGNPVKCPGSGAQLFVENALTDATLAAPIAALVSAILTKALAVGTIS